MMRPNGRFAKGRAYVQSVRGPVKFSRPFISVRSSLSGILEGISGTLYKAMPRLKSSQRAVSYHDPPWLYHIISHARGRLWNPWPCLPRPWAPPWPHGSCMAPPWAFPAGRRTPPLLGWFVARAEVAVNMGSWPKWFVSWCTASRRAEEPASKANCLYLIHLFIYLLV